MTDEKKGELVSESTEVVNTPVEKKKYRPRPNWKIWKTADRFSLKDAVALSFNIAPAKFDSAIQKDKKLAGYYRTRLKHSHLQTLPKGKVKVVQHGSSKDGVDTIVEAKSFVDFAVSLNWPRLALEFMALGGSQAEAAHMESSPIENHEKTVLSISGTRQIIKLLVTLAIEMEKEKLPPLDIDHVPGPKEDLYTVAMHLYEGFVMEKSTFNRYLKGLCKFQSGRPTEERLLQQLFPKFF